MGEREQACDSERENIRGILAVAQAREADLRIFGSSVEYAEAAGVTQGLEAALASYEETRDAS